MVVVVVVLVRSLSHKTNIQMHRLLFYFSSIFVLSSLKSLVLCTLHDLHVYNMAYQMLKHTYYTLHTHSTFIRWLVGLFYIQPKADFSFKKNGTLNAHSYGQFFDDYSIGNTLISHLFQILDHNIFKGIKKYSINL